MEGGGGGGRTTVRMLEGGLVHKRVENTNMTDCISSLQTLLNTSKDNFFSLNMLNGASKIRLFVLMSQMYISP
jgi:hypothetical protein